MNNLPDETLRTWSLRAAWLAVAFMLVGSLFDRLGWPKLGLAAQLMLFPLAAFVVGAAVVIHRRSSN